MNPATQGKPREHGYLIQLHVEQDGRMPIKATTAWLCTRHEAQKSVLLFKGLLQHRGEKKV